MANMRDVARAANVSVSTVSYAFNGNPNISTATRQRIFKTAEALGYTAHLRKKMKTPQKRSSIGLFLATFYSSYYHYMAEEMAEYSHKNYHNSLRVFIDYEINCKDLTSLLYSSGVESAIILHYQITDEWISTLKDCGIPLIFLDREITDDKVSSVLVDNYQGMCSQMEHLIRLGHKRIAFIKGDNGYDDRKRYLAYVDTLKKHFLPIDNTLILQGNFSYFITKHNLARAHPSFSNIPDAICCCNDEMAVACIEAFEQAGYSIPEDISICGFDNLYYSSISKIPLTTVINPVREISRKAVDEAIRLLEEGTHGKCQFVPSELVIRDSTTVRNK